LIKNPVGYAELRCRTHYSFLRGASHPSELVLRAAELGLHSLAITDRNGVYGVPKAYATAREHPTLNLIVGSELTLENGHRLSLLAKNRQGYGVMCRLLTASHEGKEKGLAALGWEPFTGILSRYGSGGLFASPSELRSGGDGFYGDIKDLFGKDLFFPISRFLDGQDQERIGLARIMSARFDVPVVASNDVHFHIPEKKSLHDVLSAIREGKPLDEMGTDLFSNAERYLKSPQQMIKLFSDLPDAIARTVEIAEQCRFSPSELRYRYPSEWIPEGETSQSYLEKLVWKGAMERYSRAPDNGVVPENVKAQLRHELELTEELKFADYFLTIWEIVEFARGRQILCQGRGSAANSAICYCLGVTAIDPVRMDLLFERFISAERNEPPDIDVDFEHERREEVIQHIYEKYGRDRAGMVANVICYRSRSSLREVSKVFSLSPEVISQNPKALAMIEEINGFPRHLGIHSGGFTLSKEPLIETVPIEPARMEGRTVVQWDKDDLACIGLLKVDVLALGMLTALRKMLDLVHARQPERAAPLTLATIPAEDAKTYEMIQRGETVGVFQIESRAQMGMLKRLLPENFYDLVIQIAIVRPGPIMGEMVHPYLRRRRGEEKPDIPHPKLEPILRRTLGVPLFQEQVMKIAIELAGFTPGESDELRRAINAWKSKGSIEKMGQKLMTGLLASGLSRPFVERIFKQIQGFAEYGFPESHSASFAVLAYASSYLKCHYPAEFICALINSQPMGFYSTHTLVEEARHSGVKVIPVDINRSDWDCELELSEKEGAIRIGFRVVRGMNKEACRELIAERDRGVFKSLPDFLSRTRLSPQALMSLAMGEAFKCFGLNQRDSLWEILGHRLLLLPSRESESVQMNLFEKLSEAPLVQTPAGALFFEPLSDFQAIRSDYRVFGLSTRGHPMKELRKHFKRVPPITSLGVKKSPLGRMLKIAGLVIARQRPPNAKGTCFATLEDEDGFIDLILHAHVFEKFQDVFVNEPFILVTGKVQRDVNSTSLLIHRIEAMPEAEIHVQSKDFS
jgi:error-prone DNA polymerase